jgi:hypothetical protein
MTCPPCQRDCRQGRDCPARRSVDLLPALLVVAVAALLAVLLVEMP